MHTLKFAELTIADIPTIARLEVALPTDNGFERDLPALTSEEQQHIGAITRRLQHDRTTIMNEATLWARAIYPLLMLAEQAYVRAWAQVPLQAQYPHVKLQGIADGVLGKGVTSLTGETLYLVVVVAKRGLEANDPRPQLYGQLLAAARLNWEQQQQAAIEVTGCYTIIDTWTFIQAVVEGVETDMPHMTIEISREYDQRTEAETIVKILKRIVARGAGGA
jgi:hypothetical protein